jgi:hypothetical protein
MISLGNVLAIVSIGLMVAFLVIALRGAQQQQPSVVRMPAETAAATAAAASRQQQQKQKPRHRLGLLCIAKNESMVLREFVEHYRAQGVGHIYVIDNGSTDGMAAAVSPEVREGFVSVHRREKRHAQVEHYNELYGAFCRDECEWLLVADVDEYAYGAERPLAEVLAAADDVDYAHLPWRMFGGNGHDRQPAEGVRRGFTTRRPREEPSPHGKAVFRTSAVASLGIHDHEKTDGARSVRWEGDAAPAHLNHYAIMSRQYYEEVKMTRGAADSAGSENARDWAYYEQYDAGTGWLDLALARISTSAY